MVKRGTTEHSFVLALDKPLGMTSHDVVDRVRRITGERRVGHMGTLDPNASGVLLVGVGPATRLNAYISHSSKSYRMAIQFGSATTTDDADGQVVQQAPVPEQLYDEKFAAFTIAGLVGKGLQVPPAYSAIKVNGTKAYDAARSGTALELEARPFEVFDARFEGIEVRSDAEGGPVPIWVCTLSVSKGTYMRSIARDLGKRLGTVAHVASLRRVSIGTIALDDCLTLDQFNQDHQGCIVDPLLVLSCRWAFIDNDVALNNGQPLLCNQVNLNEPITIDMYDTACCTSQVFPSATPPSHGEIVGMVSKGVLKALYAYDSDKQRYKAQCVFPIGVDRGTSL